MVHLYLRDIAKQYLRERQEKPTKDNYLGDLLYEETTFWTKIRLSK